MSRASRSPERRAARVCRSKKEICSIQEANFWISEFQKHNGKTLYHYRCQICNLWHLTSKKQIDEASLDAVLSEGE